MDLLFLSRIYLYNNKGADLISSDVGYVGNGKAGL